jgi:hypothetical protein
VRTQVKTSKHGLCILYLIRETGAAQHVRDPRTAVVESGGYIF